MELVDFRRAIQKGLFDQIAIIHELCGLDRDEDKINGIVITAY